VSYPRGPAAPGADSFVYQVCDDGGLCDTAKVSLQIGAANRNPVAVDDEVATEAEMPVLVAALDNDSDPDGDALTLFAVEDAYSGAVAIVGDEIEYSPDADFAGDDVFFYTVCDPAGACATAFVIVEVAAGENTAPVAIDDTVQTLKDTKVVVDTTANDVDFDGDPISVTAVGDASFGVAAREADGRVSYTPNAGHLGEDVFTVTIGDGRGGSATQRVLVYVTATPNQAPDAVDDAFDAPGEVATELAVLANDSDADGDALSIVGMVQPAHGTVAVNANGVVVFEPDPGFWGADRFSYVVSDGRGGTDSAWVELVVGDRDHDGLGDRHEIEVTGTDPDDADSDDDGLSDGVEGRGDGPLTAPTNPLDPDTDHDGITDGVEVGVGDADPSTTTDPNDDDSDDDGILDGNEDLNGNGKWDGELGGTGTSGSGETDPTRADTDGDGVQDGTELGLSAPQGSGTDLSKFQPDLDPGSKTDPLDSDSDDDGASDGQEDSNHNGRVDAGEHDPLDPADAPEANKAKSSGCSGGALPSLWLGLIGLALWVRRRALRTGR
jgi:hypothetical protein